MRTLVYTMHSQPHHQSYFLCVAIWKPRGTRTEVYTFNSTGKGHKIQFSYILYIITSKKVLKTTYAISLSNPLEDQRALIFKPRHITHIYTPITSRRSTRPPMLLPYRTHLKTKGHLF